MAYGSESFLIDRHSHCIRHIKATLQTLFSKANRQKCEKQTFRFQVSRASAAIQGPRCITHVDNTGSCMCVV